MAFAEMAESIQEHVLQEARIYGQQADAAILAQRGIRQLTGEETEYYEATIQAMRSSNPKQALAELDVVMPKTTIDAVFDDLVSMHPLLDAINFENTSGLIEYLVNTNGNQLATWSPLCAEIVKELTGGFKKIDMAHNKLSAFLPVCKAMLDLGPVWLDRYVRTVLQEALYLGLEQGIITGTGVNMPIGMDRNLAGPVDPTNGYPKKTPVPFTSFDPVTYGALLGGMAVNDNGMVRIINEVIMIVNPTDYLTKVMPATTIRTTDGSYNNNVFPFSTRIIQSTEMTQGQAIIGIPSRYFMGIGTAKTGRIEFSDEYHFLEDERVYLVKLYGHGQPLDNNAFRLVDITNLVPEVLDVRVINAAEFPVA